MEAAKEKSPQFQFYQQLFPEPGNLYKVIRNVGLPYPAAKKLFPERFNLEAIGNIFNDWLASVPKEIREISPSTLQTSYPKYHYVYDHLTYVSSVWVDKFVEKGSTYTNLN